MENKAYTDMIQSSIWGKVKSALGGKVDKEKGKGLSSNDYTAKDKERVDSLEPITDKQINELFREDSDYGIP